MQIIHLGTWGCRMKMKSSVYPEAAKMAMAWGSESTGKYRQLW
jgi:hypothetical protein